MKKLSILLLFLPILSWAQFSSDFVIYSADNLGFILVFNQSRINAQYQNKIVLSDVPAGEYPVEIYFSDPKYSPIYYMVQIPNSSMAIFRIEPVGYSNTHILKLQNTILYSSSSYIQPPQPAVRQPYPFIPQNGGSLQQPPPPPNYDQYCIPVSDAEFANILANLKAEAFDDSRLNLAKQIVSSKCLTSIQIKNILELFSFDDTKLQFAEYAYDYVYDPENYYIINSSFSFDSNKQKLIQYIQQHKR